MKSKLLLSCLILVLSLLCCVCFASGLLFAWQGQMAVAGVEILPGDAFNQIAVIDIDGEIVGGTTTDLFGNATPDKVLTIIDALHNAGENTLVKGVILRLNTPGGTVYDSFRLADQLIKFKSDYKKPVVALIETSAASGGYLIAAQSDRIVAANTSIVGSIGVIVTAQNTDGLFEKLGIKNITITSDGAEQKSAKRLEDITSPEYRDIKELVNDYQQMFNEYVAKGRQLPIEQVQKLADGSIDSGSRALTKKLVDKLGDQNVALAEVKSLAKLSSDPRVFLVGQKSTPSPLQTVFAKLFPTSANTRGGLDFYF